MELWGLIRAARIKLKAVAFFTRIVPLKAAGLDGREATEPPQKITEALRIKLKEELVLLRKNIRRVM